MLRRVLCHTVGLCAQQCGTILRPCSAVASASSNSADVKIPKYDVANYDVCIVGAGPAGLCAAIKLKQLAAAAEKDVSVCVLEKGPSVGAHITSGGVLDPRALNELYPKADPDDDEFAWQTLGAPVGTKVRQQSFALLTRRGRWRLPRLRGMQDHGSYIVDLGDICQWLAARAEEAGVAIHLSTAAAALLRNADGAVTGVRTSPRGAFADGQPRLGYSPPVDITARATLLAEGCVGTLAEGLIENAGLRRERDAGAPTYGLALAEEWRLRDGAGHKPGSVETMVGHPCGRSMHGVGYVHHAADGTVALGFVLALDCPNPRVSPYEEFQRFKLHPRVAKLLDGGKCVKFGARTVNMGGYQAVPHAAAPGVAILGCAAGLGTAALAPRGAAAAMKSGLLAAEAAWREFAAPGDAHEGPLSLKRYPPLLEHSWIMYELEGVRNIRPGFRWGLAGGLVNAALETYVYPWLFGGPLWTLPNGGADGAATRPAARFLPRAAIEPDNKLTFSVIDSLKRASIVYNPAQPPNIFLKSSAAVATVTDAIYGRPETFYCPADVFEYTSDSITGRPHVVIHPDRCLHCKACVVKDPTGNISWVLPEGGSGAQYK